MTLNENQLYVHGNLGRSWQYKTIEATGKQLIESALAYQPTKDDETIWIDLSCWEGREGETNHFDAIINATDKGSRVIVRGRLKSREYKAKDGTQKTGWSMSVWDIATVVRPDRRKADPYQGATAIVDGKPMTDEDWF